VDDLVAPVLTRLLEIALGPREESRRGLAISREGNDSRAQGQLNRRQVRATAKLDAPHGGPHPFGDAKGLRVTGVEQENPQAHGKATNNVRGSDELRDPSGEGDFDGWLELRVLRSHVRLEEAQGEEIAIAGTPAGLAQQEMKKGFVLKEARGWIKKGHGPAPFSPMRRTLDRPSAWRLPG
jgi:hypothetical protein